MTTRVVEHQSAIEFLASCEKWLSLREIENHTVLSLAGVLTSLHPIYQPPFRFVHVIHDQQIRGCCICAEPDGLVLSNFSEQDALAVFHYLKTNINIPSRIFGPKRPALQIAKLFEELRTTPYRIQSAWRVHCLESLLGDRLSVEGGIRIGSDADKGLVGKWGKKYDSERPANVSIKQFLLKKLADQQLYLWVDDSPKSLATISGENCSGLRISSVYTPPFYRSNGYATALVRDLSQKYLDSGSAYVTLNTQAGDPVERIYRRLGFKPVTEKLSITFESC
jgi:GNAT superfamily N-acetyltransferase